MVRALQAGTKTQTRRVLKPQPTHFNPVGVPRRARPDSGPSDVVRCPYGQPGDWLWVRETWAPRANGFAYAADPAWNTSAGGRWHPSIHMPRCASRITLEITGVRVERLQDILEEDAKAEGLSFVADGCARFGVEGLASSWCDCPVTAYAALWESINGPGSWDANPWVWAVQFRVDSAGDAPLRLPAQRQS